MRFRISVNGRTIHYSWCQTGYLWCIPMRSRAEEYRQKAVELCSKAKQQSDFAVRVEYESLAFHYMDLADQIERLVLADSEVA